jgi:class I fructose-bisphosphate aldolase
VGVLGMVAKKYADQIPFIAKLNHNDLLRYPNDYDQVMFGGVSEAFNMGAKGVGATIYFGSPESKRQLQEVSEAFQEAHYLGLFTVLWCYVRNDNFVVDGVNYETSADLTGQADYLGATIEADIVKQKLPTVNRGYEALNKKGKKYGKYTEKMYSKLASDHPIDLCRYQVANGYLGRVGLISSGGEHGKSDLHDAVYAAVVNKRAGGAGLILGRKAFQKPFEEGVKILHTVQDVYLCKEVTIS